jgi:hypothetical protein
MYKRKLRKLWRRFCITYWPWPPYLWRKHNQEDRKLKGIFRSLIVSMPRVITEKGWKTYRKRFAKVFKAAHLKEKFINWITQYPFNKYGWIDFKYWFKYRLQKKYKYNTLESGLKPGHYEFNQVLICTIAGPRFRSTFETVWKKYQESKKENFKEIKQSYHNAITKLKQAYDWFVVEKPKLQKRIEDYLIQDIKDNNKLKDINYWIDFSERKSSKKHINLIKKVNQAQKYITINDTKHAKTIIEYRFYLW